MLCRQGDTISTTSGVTNRDARALLPSASGRNSVLGEDSSQDLILARLSGHVLLPAMRCEFFLHIPTAFIKTSPIVKLRRKLQHRHTAIFAVV